MNNRWYTALNSHYVGQWYNRVISLGGVSALLGKTITEVTFYTDDSPDITTGAATLIFYADEIRINGVDIGKVNGNTGATTPGYYLEDFNDQTITDGRPTNRYRDVAANWNGNIGTKQRYIRFQPTSRRCYDPFLLLFNFETACPKQKQDWGGT